MNSFSKSTAVKFLGTAVAALTLAACGGGGGGGGGAFFPIPPGGGTGTGTVIAASGTAARGAMLIGAAVNLKCANNAGLTGVTNGNGQYVTNQVAVVYPCIGSATLGAVSYRGILYSGTVTNFTPLTDLLVEVTLAAAESGPGDLSIDTFLALAGSDATFANFVTSPAAQASYRDAVLDTVETLLRADGKSESEAEAILAAAQNFYNEAFTLGSPADLVLDNIADVVQSDDGNVSTAARVAANIAGDLLPTPPRGGTGGTGGTGATGG